MKTRMWVNYHEISGPIVIEREGKITQARRVDWNGPSRLISVDRSLPKPNIWIETESDIRVVE